jgi:predicted PurR-regulated permease PerM
MSLPRYQRHERPRGDERRPPAQRVESHGKLPRLTGGLFILASIAALYLARDFFIPLSLALLFALILSPMVQSLARHQVPTPAGAGIVLAAFLGFLALGGYLVSGPISIWAEKGPETVQRVSAKVRSMMQPVRKLSAATETQKSDQEQPQKVEVKQPGILKSVAARTGTFVGVAGTTFLLVYFLLASGDALLTSILRSISNHSRRERTLEIGNEIKRHISKYLFAITMINVVEGILIASGLAIAGMPTPILWGAMHVFLNYIPFVGPLTGLAITSVVSFISFESVPRAIVPPIIYVAVMMLDNFVGPLVLGKRLVLNPALVFVSLMFWGWLWGIVGILIAIPVLIGAKIVCDAVPHLNRYGRIISAHNM